jgi:hypothetical protein
MGMEQLNALGSMADETDAANPSAEQQEQASQEQAQEAQADVAAKQWGMLMFTLGGFSQMIAPELRQVYTQQRCLDWGHQANAVAEKYGWNGPSTMPELALIASTAGFLVPTYLAIDARLRQAKAAKDGTLGEKLAAWWQHRKAQRAARRQAAQAPGDVVAEAGGNGE